MVDSPESFAPFEPELLVATCLPEGSLVSANDAWQSVFGPYENAWAHLSPEDQVLVVQCVEEAAGGSLVTNQIFPVQTAERDEPLFVLLHFLPVQMLDENEQPCIGAITISGEVLVEPTSWTVNQTQRHRLETLGRMTMGIAHDFNNLLSGILGYTELLKTFNIAPPLFSTYTAHLGTIEKAALDGAALVRKIQQYIRQEKQTLFEPLDLPSLVQDCVSFTRPYWYNEPRRQGIDIQLALDLNEVPPVMGSAAELREVFVNLILNAVQAMPTGGHLSLSTFYREHEGVQVQISDTGTGMSETVRSRIFEPLFTTKGEYGTGMGLAVSYGIIQEHEGAVSFTSKLGKGTTFTLTFPPALEATFTQEEESVEPPSESARILLVDDEEMVRSVLTKLLTLRGHTVWAAASGPEALVLTQARPFDIVIVDQAMPEMNGRELAQILRRRYPDLPIVLLTGDTEVGDPDHAINVILSKPFQIKEVEATIQKLI
ncbi:MAG: ATP-binding protein [Rhodothermales bacterium]